MNSTLKRHCADSNTSVALQTDGLCFDRSGERQGKYVVNHNVGIVE